MKPPQRFRTLSIEAKLRLLIMATCAAVMLPTCAAYVAFKWHHHRALVVSVMQVRIQILAANVAGPLAFSSEEDAAEVLGALAADPEVVVAGLFDRAGEVVAGFPDKRAVEKLKLRPVSTVDHSFENGGMWVWAPVKHGERRLGTLALKHSLAQMRLAIAQVAAVSTGLLLLALALSYFIAAGFQRVISAPLLALADVARRVGDTRDFSLRVARVGDDEIGLVARQFNSALAAIQQREGALLESEARKGAILESSLDAIITIDHEGRVREFNPAAEKLFGYGAREAAGRELGELIIPPELRVAHRRGMARYLSTGQGHVLGRRIEMPAMRADGTVLHVELAITRLGTAEPPLFTGFIRDITERRRVEKAMQESEERFRTLAVATAQMVWTTDAAGQVVGPLPTWQAYTGQTEEEVRGAGWAKAVHPEDVLAVKEAWRQAVATGATYEIEYRIRRHDGAYRHFAVRGVPVRSPDGSVREWVGACTDITDRRKSEEDIRRSAERLMALNRLDRIIISNLELGRVFAAFVREMQGLVTCDYAAMISLEGAQGKWEISHGWARSPGSALDGGCGPLEDSGFGWVAAQRRTLIESKLNPVWAESESLAGAGMKSRAVFPLVLHDRVIALFMVARAGEGAFDRDAIDFLQALSDQLAVAIQNNRLFAEVKRYADELEQRVEERTQQLRNANRELEAFSYSVSHDLRSPLRAMAGFARILVEEHGPKMEAEVQRYLGLIQENAQRMGRLIDDLLTFSRLNRQKLTKVRLDLERLCADVLSDLRHEMQGRRISVKVAPLPEVDGDPALLRQALTNLLSNAVKYTRPRGEAVIEVGVREEAGERVFFVRDNGVGFDMRHAEKLFGVFQRLHRQDEFEGTGVGLAIVQRVIHRHGGRIWPEAAPGAGATFNFTLPNNKES